MCIRDRSYTAEVSTVSSNQDTEFRVIANMEEGNFASFRTGIGQSIDNIHPTTPELMAGEHLGGNEITLGWSYEQDIDFSYHQVTDLGQSIEYTTQNSLSTAQDQFFTSYKVSSVDINNNTSGTSNPVSGHRLHYGNNLIGMPVLPDNTSVSTVLESLGLNANAIIGQGLASNNVESLGWVGSLTGIDPGMGFWVHGSAAGRGCSRSQSWTPARRAPAAAPAAGPAPRRSR